MSDYSSIVSSQIKIILTDCLFASLYFSIFQVVNHFQHLDISHSLTLSIFLSPSPSLSLFLFLSLSLSRQCPSAEEDQQNKIERKWWTGMNRSETPIYLWTEGVAVPRNGRALNGQKWFSHFWAVFNPGIHFARDHLHFWNKCCSTSNGADPIEMVAINKRIELRTTSFYLFLTFHNKHFLHFSRRICSRPTN